MKRTLTLFATLLSSAALHAAEIKLPALFTDAMILQRDAAVPVWGWAHAGEEVSVEFAGQKKSAKADANGKWMVKLDPLAASAEPHEMNIGGLVIHDVLVGDVWICSGQSNMEFGVQRTLNADAEIARALYPQLRLFTVGRTPALHPVETLTGQWSPCTPESIKAQGTWGGFSAVGYFFGRDLLANVKVPIGLIQCAVGSTPAEAWTSAEALAQFGPDFALELAGLAQVDEAVRAGRYDSARLLADWQAQCGIRAEISTPGFDASGWKTMHRLPHLWNGNDDPALRDFLGAVWLRKEIELPAQFAGQPAELQFGDLDDADVTWVNGVKVGGTTHLGPRKYAVPAGVLKPGRNVIATWVLNTAGGGGMSGKPDELLLQVAGAAPISLAGDWQFQVRQSLDQLPPRLFAIRENAGWPSALFNGMVAPLTPFGIAGVIWYQGEANVGRAAQYQRLLPALITDWRSRWGQGDLPFLVVQLAGFGRGPGAQPAESALAELRDAQSFTARTLPNVGLATAVDLGDPNDLHPSNKQEVGRRLALVALEKTYGQKIESSGPRYDSLQAEGSRIHVKFTHADGLSAKGGPLKMFAIAGADKKFVWADATIEADTVIVSSPQVPQPTAVRYAWADNPVGSNLSNKVDLPATPFRTDTAPLRGK